MSETKSPQQDIPPAERAARQVCSLYDPSDTVKGLLSKLPSDAKAADLLTELMQKEEYQDCLELLSYLLPLRKGIWWAAQVVWNCVEGQPSKQEQIALRHTMDWVNEPTEENRQAAGQVAKRMGASNPFGALAMATFYTGGSISLPGLPEVLPPPGSGERLVSAAVICGNAKMPEKIREMLLIGVNVLRDENSFDAALKNAQATRGA